MAYNRGQYNNNASSIRDPYSTVRYVHIDSDEFKQFIRKLEQNYDHGNTKMSACLLCWGFLTSYQKQKHLEHAHYTITPSFLRNEDMYMKHAKAHDKIKEGGTMIALMNDQCKIIVGNPYIVAPSNSQQLAHMNPANQGLSQDKNLQGQSGHQLLMGSQQSQYSQFTRSVPAKQVMGSFQNHSYSNVTSTDGRSNMPMNSLSFNQVKDVQQRQFDQEQIIKKLTLNVMCLQDKVKSFEMKIGRLESILERSLNDEHRQSGQKSSENVVFKKDDQFIQTGQNIESNLAKSQGNSQVDHNEDTAETSPQQDPNSQNSNEDLLLPPPPGIDTKYLMGSQIGGGGAVSSIINITAPKENKITCLQDNYKYDKHLINKKSKTIKKDSKTHKPDKSKMMKLNVLEDHDGPSLAAFSTRQQENYKQGHADSESQLCLDKDKDEIQKDEDKLDLNQ